jgi:hypothetical protein
MYLGRQVVRRPASTLRPVAGSVVRASTSTPWQIAPIGRPRAQNAATWFASSGEPRYWRIPGAWPPGSSSPSNADTSADRQLIGSAKAADSAIAR